MLEPFDCAIPKSVFFCGNTAPAAKGSYKTIVRRNVFFELGLWQAQLCAGIFLSELCLWQAQFCAGPLSFELGLWQAQFCGFFCLNLVCGRPSQPPLNLLQPPLKLHPLAFHNAMI